MTTSAPLSTFDPLTWSDVASATLTTAGAQHVLARPAAISLEWPVVPPVPRAGSDDDDDVSSIPLELQQQDGGTLIVVALFAWTLSVTDANKKLVDLIAAELCRKHDRGNKSFIDINWQYNDEGQRDAPFSLDDYIHADGADWLEQLLTSAHRFELIFRALDPLVQQAAAGVFEAGRAHVVVHALVERLSGRHLPPEVARLHDAFPAITMGHFVGGVLRAIKADAAPEDALQALDHPLLAHVDEVSVSFEADAVARWLAGPGMPRPVKIVDIAALDAKKPAVVGALLAPFKDCTHLSLHLDDQDRFKGVAAVAAVVPAFTQLEVLEIDCDASAAVEKKLLDLLLSQPMPKLRRFTLNSHGKRSGAASLASILKRLPETVTELGLWQDESWPALRDKLLDHDVMQRLTAVGVKDDVDELNDPRLAGKKLFGPPSDIDNVAHDLHEVGRHQHVVDMIGPLRWKTRDVDIHSRYAMSLAELDPEAGVDAWRTVLAIEPTQYSATHNLANQLVLLGRLEEAHPVVVAALAQQPREPWMLRCMAVIWQSRGDTAQARHWSEQFAQAIAEEVVDAGDDVDGSTLYAHACGQMWLQLPEVALRTLEDAVAAGLSGVTPHLDVEWEPLRADPRWRRLFPQRP